MYYLCIIYYLLLLITNLSQLKKYVIIYAITYRYYRTNFLYLYLLLYLKKLKYFINIIKKI